MHAWHKRTYNLQRIKEGHKKEEGKRTEQWRRTGRWYKIAHWGNEIKLAARTNIWGDALLNIKELNRIKDGDEVVVS